METLLEISLTIQLTQAHYINTGSDATEIVRFRLNKKYDAHGNKNQAAITRFPPRQTGGNNLLPFREKMFAVRKHMREAKEKR